MLAADGDGVDMDAIAAVEDGDRGGAAAEIDQRAAELGLVVDEHRQAAGIGRGDQRLDREMAAVDAELEIAERRRVGGDHVHVDAEPLAEHAARVGDAAVGVERIADRQRVDDGAARRDRMAAPGGKHAADIGFLDLLAGEGDARRVGLAGQASAGDVDDERLDGDPGHALGRVDGEADRLLGGVEIGDDARLDAARALMADAEHLDRVGASRAAPRPIPRAHGSQPPDQAADLARADVENRDDGGAPRQAAHSGLGRN